MDEAELKIKDGVSWPIVIEITTPMMGMCPSQLQARTQNGQDVYVRYRFGWLKVIVDNEWVFIKRVGENLTPEKLEEEFSLTPDLPEEMKEATRKSHAVMWGMAREDNPSNPFVSYDGVMTYDELVQHTREYFEWPDAPDEGYNPLDEVPSSCSAEHE